MKLSFAFHFSSIFLRLNPNTLILCCITTLRFDCQSWMLWCEQTWTLPPILHAAWVLILMSTLASRRIQAKHTKQAICSSELFWVIPDHHFPGYSEGARALRFGLGAIKFGCKMCDKWCAVGPILFSAESLSRYCCHFLYPIDGPRLLFLRKQHLFSPILFGAFRWLQLCTASEPCRVAEFTSRDLVVKEPRENWILFRQLRAWTERPFFSAQLCRKTSSPTFVTGKRYSRIGWR